MSGECKEYGRLHAEWYELGSAQIDHSPEIAPACRDACCVAGWVACLVAGGAADGRPGPAGDRGAGPIGCLPILVP
jgi:hypothetical protein